MPKNESTNLSFDVENDQVYDEIDRFHLAKDDSILDFGTYKQKARKKEILSVRVDKEDDIDYEDQDVYKKFSEIKETSDKWGRKRTNFYGTSYVDQDFGGVNDSEEEELLDLEEKDAIERQKRQDSALMYANFGDFEDENDDDDTCLDFQVARDNNENEKNNEEKPNRTEKKKKKAKSTNVKQNSAEKRTESRDNEQLLKDDELTFVIENRQNSGEKRAVTKQIMKNKGLTAKRRKDSKHARIKNRKLYDKALIRRRSQVPDVRREIKKYDGEKRGIHASTIRSIKLR